MSAKELSGRLGRFQERTRAFNFLSGLSLSRGGSYFLNLGGKTGSGKPASRARVEYFVNTERGVPFAPIKAVNADQASLSFSDSFAHLLVCWRKGVQVLPTVYELGPAIPNPTNGATTIRYSLPKESQVNFTIYNVAGQVVREYKPGKQDAGFYTYKWDGRSNRGHKVGAGIYFYRLEAGSWVKTRKMLVIR